MSWEDIIKYKYTEPPFALREGEKSGLHVRNEEDLAVVEKIFEKQLQQRGGRLTRAKANRLIYFYEKLKDNKFSKEEIKDIAFVYTQER
tara:strand:+ start:161 stop:427 length:267 start_codon:yes stop_codon:yes gene_type:complete